MSYGRIHRPATRSVLWSAAMGTAHLVLLGVYYALMVAGYLPASPNVYLLVGLCTGISFAHCINREPCVVPVNNLPNSSFSIV
jgi:hypothetical protein